jgi:pre-mRNA-splicing factor RBM22/SLT11
MPKNDELSKQNIQDRYYGRNDPVASKILNTHAAKQGLQPPEDQAVVR